MYICIVKIKRVINNFKKRKMTDEELEQEIKKVKQMLADYQRLKDLLKPSEKEFERQIDILLERLSKLLKQRK